MWIPCRIEKVYYDNIHQSRWIDALGDEGKVSDIEVQLKDNISSEITEDINKKIELALCDPKNYRKGAGTAHTKPQEVAWGQIISEGNYYEISKVDSENMEVILDFIFNMSSHFKSHNTIFQKGYFFDHEKTTDDKAGWKVIETNMPSLKRIGIVANCFLINKLSTNKLANAFNTKYIDLKVCFVYVKDVVIYWVSDPAEDS